MKRYERIELHEKVKLVFKFVYQPKQMETTLTKVQKEK